MSDRRRAPHHQVQYHQMQADRNVLVSTFSQRVGRAMPHCGFVKDSHVESQALSSFPSHTQQSRKVPTCGDHLFSSIPDTALHRPLFSCARHKLRSFRALGRHMSKSCFGDRAVDAEELKEIEHDKEKGRRQNSTSRTRRWTRSKTKWLVDLVTFSATSTPRPL